MEASGIYRTPVLGPQARRQRYRVGGTRGAFHPAQAPRTLLHRPVSKNGYFRGDETVNYVRNVIGRWEFYKKRIPR